jgi:photosystem II stability/assembly factor-like uncharacterized protein
MKLHFYFSSMSVMLLAVVLAASGVLAARPYAGRVEATQPAALDWEVVLPDLPTRIWRSPWYENNTVLYVTTGEDLRRTHDNGDMWEMLYPPPPIQQAQGISALAFDPAAAEMPTLFLARNPSKSPADILRSVDDGATWNTVFTTPGGPLQDMAAARDGNGALVVWAVGGTHVWRSTDGGDTWLPAETGLPANPDLYRVYASPTFASDATLYLAAFGALFRSTNGGDTWAQVLIPYVNVPRHVVFSPNYAADGTLWISTFWIEGQGEYPPNGVVRSTDAGATWEMVNLGLPVNYLDGWIMGLDVSPDYGENPTLYAVERIQDGSWQVYRTRNGGGNWTRRGAAPSVFPTGLLMATPHLLFLSTQAGLFRLNIPEEMYLPVIMLECPAGTDPKGFACKSD